jgi:hypothetical protein
MGPMGWFAIGRTDNVRPFFFFLFLSFSFPFFLSFLFEWLSPRVVEAPPAPQPDGKHAHGCAFFVNVRLFFSFSFFLFFELLNP